jgi:hypothetical protein
MQPPGGSHRVTTAEDPNRDRTDKPPGLRGLHYGGEPVPFRGKSHQLSTVRPMQCGRGGAQKCAFPRDF